MELKRNIRLGVTNMQCPACPGQVERALKRVPGVEAVRIPGWISQTAEVVVDSSVDERDLLLAAQAAGYPAAVKSRQVLNVRTRPSDAGGAEGDQFDLLVIGGGSAGFAAAIKGVELGARVALVEANTLGGTCVNVGCIPSKALVQVGGAWHSAAHHPFRGAHTAQQRFDWSTVRAEMEALVAGMRKAKYEDVLAAYPEITFIEGHASFWDDGSVRVGGEDFRASHYVIATGGRPNMIRFPGFEQAEPLNSTTLMELEELPRSLIILGGRAIAVELGQAMARFGVEVLILQRSARLLPDHEPLIGRAVKAMLEREGVGVIPGAQVVRLGRQNGDRIVAAQVMGQQREFRADHILMALGRRPNTLGMGLERVGVDLDESGAVVVDEYLTSSNPRIYAAGDVTPHPELVYVAAMGAARAAQNALSADRRPLDLSVVPSVIFTEPQIASVGMTESEARQNGFAARVSTLDLEHVARAQVEHNTQGFIQLVADTSTGRLLGAHVLAPSGGELIQTATLAIKFGMTIEHLIDTLFPYLTQVEGIKLAALAFDKDVSLLSCCAA